MGEQSVKNAKDSAKAVMKTKEKLHEDQIALDQAELKDLQTKSATEIAKFKALVSAKRLDVQGGNLSERRKGLALSALDREESTGILAREVKSMQDQLPVYMRLLKEKEITDEEYYKFIEQLNEKQEQLNNALANTAENAKNKIIGIKGIIQNAFQDIFNFKPGSQGDQLLAQTLQETYNVALDATNNYFDAKQARIKQDQQLQLQQLDTEKQSLLSHAQTQEEKLAIEKRFKDKEAAVNKSAFEKQKKQRIAQAEINLGLQLSNLAVIAFSPNPANNATLGVAGAIMYAVQAALAVARFALNVSRIKRAQFEKGGDVPTRGGKFGGRPHSQGGTPFEFKGRQYEAEVDELSIIRTKNAPRDKIFNIVGNQQQIASALNKIGGGIDFASGARVSKFASGGHLGEVLQPPVFVPAVNQTVVRNDNSRLEKKFDELSDRMADLANEQSKRIDRLEVVQVTDTVTKAQKKQVKQSNIGTL